MNRFVGFIVKEFRHIFRDRRTLLILFGMPVVQLILFGYAIRNELTDAEIAILDYSRDPVTTRITEKLTASGYFSLVRILDHPDQIEGVFRRGKAGEVIVFEGRFAEKLVREGSAHVQIITDASNPNMAQMLLGYTTAIIRDYQLEMNDGADVQPAVVTSQVSMLFNPEQRSANLFVPGLIAVILMLVSALMTSITIAREKETGTMEILLVSPLRPFQIILGKVTPYLLLSLINVVSVLALAQIIFDVPFRGSYTLFLLQSLLFIVTALSLGVLISTVTRSQQVAMMVSLVALLMPTVLLSGFIFPIANMPGILQWLSHLIPAKWFLIIVRGIMLKGVGIDALLKETLILMGMTAGLLVLSIRNFSVRLHQ